VPTYGSYLGTIPIGGHSPVSYVCGLDAPNLTNHSPKNAVASIDGIFAGLLPISTQFGCAQFVVYVSATNGTTTAPCGYAYASINGGKWILVADGENYLLVTGVKHNHHVGAYFPFYIPPPAANTPGCPISTTTIPPTTTPTTVPGQTTTTAVPPTSSTLPGFTTTTGIFNAGSTTTIPKSLNSSPGSALGGIIETIIIISTVVAAGAAAVGAGGFLLDIPEQLAEEYTTELPPGGGLPFSLFPSGSVGSAGELSDSELAAIVAAATTDLPPGGGFPVAGAVAEGTASEEFVVELADDEEVAIMLIFTAEDTDIPPGGGASFGELTASGGIAVDEGGSSQESGR
jgi:hypothetical protein